MLIKYYLNVFLVYIEKILLKSKTSHKSQSSNDPKFKLKRLDDKFYNDYKKNL